MTMFWILQILLLCGISHIQLVYGDYYDITTVYRFNTEEYYEDGEVITKYLNTCAVSVHPQTNAVNLPFINLNPLSDDKMQYPTSSIYTAFSTPFNTTWKAETSPGVFEDLKESLLEHDILQTFIDEKIFLEFLGKGKVLKIKRTSDSNILSSTEMRSNIFLFLQINKGDIEAGCFTILLVNSQNHKTYVNINSKNEISVGLSSSSNRQVYNLKENENGQISFYINVNGTLSIYDAVAQKVYTTNYKTKITKIDWEQYGRVMFSTAYEYCNLFSFRGNYLKNISIVQVPLEPMFSLEKNIVSPDLKKNFTLFLTSVRKNNSKLSVYLNEMNTSHSVQLDTNDFITLNTNQTDLTEFVLTNVKIRFPHDWKGEKRISIQGDENIFITNIWEGGNVEAYPIDDKKLCSKSNTKDIYGVIFRDPMTNLSVSSCLNGGVKDTTCACPPGFTGDRCEIACGRNYFGKQCSQTCTDTDNGCKGMLLCTPYYGCSCAPGYHGDQCLQECEEGYYGADCRQTCGYCKVACDKYTGECSECDSPYLLWPSCKVKNPYWTGTPVIEDSTFTTLILSLDFNSSNIKTFSNTIEFFIMQFKEKSEKEWKNSSLEPFKPGKVSHVVQNLEPGKLYYFRVLLVDESLRTNDPELSKTIVGTTKCIVSKIDNNLDTTRVTNSSIALIWKKETGRIQNNECPFANYILEINGMWKSIVKTRKILNITENQINVKELKPGYSYDIKLKKNTVHGESIAVSEINVTTKSTTDITMGVTGILKKVSGPSIFLEWYENPLYKTYYIKYKLKRRFSCSLEEIVSVVQEIPTIRINYTLNLEPYAQYEIFITIDQHQVQSGRNITGVTEGAYPTVSPSLKNERFTITNESIKIVWDDPDLSCMRMNGLFKKYSVQILDTHNTIIDDSETIEKVLEIKGLHPVTEYKLKVRYVNHVGASPFFSEYSFKTKSTSFLNADELTAYKMNAHSVGLRWKISNTNATVTSIMVTVQSQSGTESFNITNLAQLRCTAWASYMCYNVAQLKQNTKYTISLVVHSEEFPEGGNRKSIQAITRETAPSPVSDIKLESIFNKNMTISWKIPRLLNGTLRKFLIEIEHLSAFDEALCCQGITTITKSVTDEQETYSQVIENIIDASSYQVTIRAFTKRLGQETSKIIDIPPSFIPIVKIPDVKIDDKEVDWQNLTANASFRHDLVTDVLIIVEGIDKETQMQVETSPISSELGQHLSSNWWIAYVCKVDEQCAVNIGTGDEADSVYGKVQNKPLESNLNYRIVLVQVNKYLSAKSYTITKSTSFTKREDNWISTTTSSANIDVGVTEFAPSDIFTEAEKTTLNQVPDNRSQDVLKTTNSEHPEDEYNTGDYTDKEMQLMSTI